MIGTKVAFENDIGRMQFGEVVSLDEAGESPVSIKIENGKIVNVPLESIFGVHEKGKDKSVDTYTVCK